VSLCFLFSGPEVNEAAQQIKRAAEGVGKRMWAIGDGPTLLKQGFTFLCIAEPIGLLEATMRDTVNRLKASKAMS